MQALKTTILIAGLAALTACASRKEDFAVRNRI